MNQETQLAAIRRRTRRRFTFTGIALCLYFSFALVWTDAGKAFSQPIAGTPVNGALLMFVALIVIFIVMEFLFLRISARDTHSETKQKNRDNTP